MKLLDTQLVHLFHYMDNLSMLCLIVLEDLEQEASFDSDNLESISERAENSLTMIFLKHAQSPRKNWLLVSFSIQMRR